VQATAFTSVLQSDVTIVWTFDKLVYCRQIARPQIETFLEANDTRIIGPRRNEQQEQA